MSTSRTAVIRHQEMRARMYEEWSTNILENGGMVPNREVRASGHRGPVYQVVWHMPWYDGNFACGLTWARVKDPLRQPRKVLHICGGCRSAIRQHEGAEEVERTIAATKALVEK